MKISSTRCRPAASVKRSPRVYFPSLAEKFLTKPKKEDKKLMRKALICLFCFVAASFACTGYEAAICVGGGHGTFVNREICPYGSYNGDVMISQSADGMTITTTSPSTCSINTIHIDWGYGSVPASRPTPGQAKWVASCNANGSGTCICSDVSGCLCTTTCAGCGSGGCTTITTSSNITPQMLADPSWMVVHTATSCGQTGYGQGTYVDQSNWFYWFNYQPCDVDSDPCDHDTVTPTVQCPADISVSTDAETCGAAVSFSTDSTDNCGTPAVSSSPSSGSVFTKGTQTVTSLAVDESGNTASCNFDVTVNDNEKPTIQCPADVTVSTDAGTCGAAVSFSTDSTDNCGTPAVSSSPSSGSVFTKGTQTVTSLAVDESGNTASCNFDVTVNDNEKPTIQCPADVTVDTTPGRCDSPVQFNALASDNCDGVTLSNAPGSGSLFLLGNTRVSSVATDAEGNSASCGFNVKVEDHQSPEIVCLGDIATNTDLNQCFATVEYSYTASDNCGYVAVTSSTTASQFAPGTNVVTYTAVDGSGNSNSCRFSINVVDNQPPSITCKDATVKIVSGTGTISGKDLVSSESDNCGLKDQVTNLVYDCTDIGKTYNVVVTAQDLSGNTASCISHVTVVDGDGKSTYSNALCLGGGIGNTGDTNCLHGFTGGYVTMRNDATNIYFHVDMTSYSQQQCYLDEVHIDWSDGKPTTRGSPGNYDISLSCPQNVCTCAKSSAACKCSGTCTCTTLGCTSADISVSISSFNNGFVGDLCANSGAPYVKFHTATHGCGGSSQTGYSNGVYVNDKSSWFYYFQFYGCCAFFAPTSSLVLKTAVNAKRDVWGDILQQEVASYLGIPLSAVTIEDETRKGNAVFTTISIRDTSSMSSKDAVDELASAIDEKDDQLPPLLKKAQVVNVDNSQLIVEESNISENSAALSPSAGLFIAPSILIVLVAFVALVF